jgi:hypothetical protein
MSESNTAKQAKDIAEATNTSVDNVHKLATFLDSLFGNVISNSFGLLGDKLAYYRLQKAIALQEAVDEKLRKRGVEKRYVPVAFGLPIIEKATVEESPILREKWANLLANARDATYGKPLRRNFSTMLADMEPVDAQILDILVREYLAMPSDRDSHLFVKEMLVNGYKLPTHVVENSVRNLMRLGLIKPGVISTGIAIGTHLVSSYKDTEMFQVTGLGIDFFHAVNDAPSKS